MKIGALIVFFSLLISLETYAVGITPPHVEVQFIPGEITEIQFEVINGYNAISDISLNVKTEIDKKYFRLSTDTLELKPYASGVFQLTIDMQKNMEPGRHGLFVSAFEKPRFKGGGIGGYAQVTSIVVVDVPYPGKYLGVTLDANDVSEGDDANILLNVKSKGKDPISNIEGRVEIADESLAKIMEIPVEAFSLGAGEEKEIKKTFKLEKHPAGTYTALALLNYDGQFSTTTTEFKVGTLLAELTNYTEELEVNKINKFSMWIGNKWNKPIKELYASISIYQGPTLVSTIKTPTIDLLPFEIKELTTYIDTTGWTTGVYNAKVSLFYEGETTIEDINIKIYKKLELNIMAILIVVVALIILIDIIVIMRRKHHVQKARVNIKR